MAHPRWDPGLCRNYRVRLPTKKRADATRHSRSLGPHDTPFSSAHIDQGPNWPIRSLFFHLCPDILSNERQDLWDEIGIQVLDKFSTGMLMAWGRPDTGAGRPLCPIEPSYWRDAKLIHTFFLPGADHEGLVHARSEKTGEGYRDLRVNRMQVLSIWPEPHTSGAAQGNDPVLKQLRHDISWLSSMLRRFNLTDAQRTEAIERYRRVDESDHPIWNASREARERRGDFINRCGIMLASDRLQESWQERQETVSEMHQFGEELERILREA